MGMLHNHDILNYCTASNKHVRTYDNVTYNYEMHDCWTLVSAHCVEDPEFAVFMKKDQNKQMALMVFIGGHKIEIVPSSSSRYYITVNETTHLTSARTRLIISLVEMLLVMALTLKSPTYSKYTSGRDPSPSTPSSA